MIAEPLEGTVLEVVLTHSHVSFKVTGYKASISPHTCVLSAPKVEWPHCEGLEMAWESGRLGGWRRQKSLDSTALVMTYSLVRTTMVLCEPLLDLRFLWRRVSMIRFPFASCSSVVCWHVSDETTPRRSVALGFVFLPGSEPDA